MKLILTRHGETKENIAEIIQGQIPGTLSKTGKHQAKKLALRLKDEKIDYIYSSDLARASDTTKAIAKFHPKTKIKFVKDLRERYFGIFQGKKREEVMKERDKELKNNNSKVIETQNQLFERANKFLQKILIKHPNETILLVAHGVFNKFMISAIMRKGPGHFKKIEYTHNTGIWIFEIDKNKNHKIHTSNCIKHLT